MPSLYELEKKGDVPGIINMYHNSKNVRVKGRALEILGEIGGDEALKVLIDAVVNQDNKKIKNSAAKAIAWADEDSLKALMEKIQGVKVKGTSALVAHLVKMLSSKERSLRMNAAIALGRLGDEKAVGKLVKTMRDSSPRVRSAAATALGMIGDQRTVDPLVSRLNDESKEVRKAALEALNDLTITEEHVDKVKSFLKDPDPRIRELTASLLGSDGEKALDPLLSALEDDMSQVRVNTVHSLLNIMSNTSADRSEEVRKKVSEGLIHSSETVNVIIEVLEKTSSNPIKRNAIWILGQLEDPRGSDILASILERGTSEERRLAATSLVKIGSVDDLVDKIEHEDEEVRMLTCWILGEAGDKSVKHVLDEALEDPIDKVRSLAFQAINKINRKV